VVVKSEGEEGFFQERKEKGKGSRRLSRES